MAAAAGLVLLFLALPILALLPMSLNAARWLELPPREISLRWYAAFLTDRDWIEATLVSLRVAVGAAALAVLLGTPAGVALARGQLPGRAAWRTLALSPVGVPLIVLAVALYHLFGRAGLVGTATGLVLAHALLGTPYVVLSVEAAARAVDVRLERAARSLGADAWQAFRRVTLPLIRAGVLAGGLFAFVASLDEVVMAMFLSGTSAITLPKLMWDSITQDELNPVVAAVASLQVGVAALAVGAGEWLRRRTRARLAPAAVPAGPDGGEPPAGPAVALAPAARVEAAPLRLVGLTVRFGTVLAVDDVTLEVRPGELVTLLGPSGSGKSSLLNAVAGFEPPAAGEVYLGTRRITGEPPDRRDIGMVFQDFALFPHLTVFENVAFPLRLRRVGEPEVRARVAEALALVRLGGLGDRSAREISGGQQQRVALARALVFRPPLLLMDEPFGALDRHLRARLQGELRQLQRRLGITVLFVTHDRAEALVLSDRIVVIDRGRVQQVGRPAELYEAPATAFVADFVGDATLLPAVVLGADGDRLRVRTAGGTELAPGPVGDRPPLGPGAACTVALRPASLRLHAGRGPGPSAVVGAIEAASYLGGLVEYRVRINVAEVLVVRMPKPAGTAALAPGTAVRVEWPPEALRLL
jgi:ABC-type Fe3+/spermidine/putrescine transport system ATPase subunit/ABC-type spermidine/putrescine transport system permease subunit II